VMSSRTLPSERDRKMTILLTPFMSYSAKAPIYAFFALAFFPKHAALVTIGLYVLGIVVGILAAAVLRLTVFRGEAVPFVMELPNYRMPSAKNVAQLLWEKAKDFLTRAFTVIFVATIVIWVLQNFDYRLNYIGDGDTQNGLLAILAGLIAPVFKPLGFGNWQCSTALISGFLAKESVVSTLQILFGDTVTAVISPVAAASLLVFCLLYTPCIAAVASVRRELGRRWAAAMIVSQCVVAWVVAFVIHSIGLLL
ncbi:MAG: ferrous iron transporter B, partial [Lachnospiraceae bacterium]|nr:ferrous iron transporter B [Lachnospiraceae bacterium]